MRNEPLMTLLSFLVLLCVHGSLLVEQWGPDSLRVRLGPGDVPPKDLPSALLSEPPTPHLRYPASSTAFENGNLRMDLVGSTHQFTRVSDGKVLLSLDSASFLPPLPFHSLPAAAFNFSLGSSEVFGLGQQRQACYAEGGAQTPPLGRVFTPGTASTLSLARGEGGAANTLPWLLGATVGRGAEWGLWVNVPAMGEVALDARLPTARTVNFSLAAVFQLDYLVTTTPAGEAAPPPPPPPSSPYFKTMCPGLASPRLSHPGP